MLRFPNPAKMQNRKMQNRWMPEEKRDRPADADVYPPAPLEIAEDDELKIKRWEQLLELVKLGHDQAHQRWDAIEAKMMNYLTLLGVVVAAAALGGVGEVAGVYRQRQNWLDWVFLLAYGGVGVFGVGAESQPCGHRPAGTATESAKPPARG